VRIRSGTHLKHSVRISIDLKPRRRLCRDRAQRAPRSQQAELAKDFVKRILDIDWAWISDESTLCDFHSEETNESSIKKIRDVYGVDVSDISDGNLADIFDRILENRTARATPDQRTHLN
jgi:hypothetical protein